VLPSLSGSAGLTFPLFNQSAPRPAATANRPPQVLPTPLKTDLFFAGPYKKDHKKIITQEIKINNLIKQFPEEEQFDGLAQFFEDTFAESRRRRLGILTHSRSIVTSLFNANQKYKDWNIAIGTYYLDRVMAIHTGTINAFLQSDSNPTNRVEAEFDRTKTPYDHLIELGKLFPKSEQVSNPDNQKWILYYLKNYKKALEKYYPDDAQRWDLKHSWQTWLDNQKQDPKRRKPAIERLDPDITNIEGHIKVIRWALQQLYNNWNSIRRNELIQDITNYNRDVLEWDQLRRPLA